MALIQCKECEKEISSEAESCPSCGAPLKPIKKKGGFLNFIKRMVLRIVVILAVLYAGFLYMTSSFEETVSEVKDTIQDTTSKVNKAVQDEKNRLKATEKKKAEEAKLKAVEDQKKAEEEAKLKVKETPPPQTARLTEKEMLTVLKEMFATPPIGTTWSKTNNICLGGSFYEDGPSARFEGWAHVCQARTMKFHHPREDRRPFETLDDGIFNILSAERFNQKFIGTVLWWPIMKPPHRKQITESLDGHTLPLFRSKLEVGYVFSEDRKLRATIQASVEGTAETNLFRNIKAAEDALMKVYSDQEFIAREEREGVLMFEPKKYKNGMRRALFPEDYRHEYHIVTLTFGCKARLFDHQGGDSYMLRQTHSLTVLKGTMKKDSYGTAIDEIGGTANEFSPFNYYMPMADFEFYENDNKNAKTCTLVTLAERVKKSKSFDEEDQRKLSVAIFKIDPKLPGLRSVKGWN